MTDFRTLFEARRSTAEELAARVESGWLIGMDAAVAGAPCILEALAERAKQDELKGVRIQTLLDVYPYAFYADNSLYGKLTGEAWFSGGAGSHPQGGGL